MQYSQLYILMFAMILPNNDDFLNFAGHSLQIKLTFIGKKTEFRLSEFHILQSAYHESEVTYLFGH